MAIDSILLKYRINWYTPLTNNQLIRMMVVIDRNEETAEWNTPSELLQSVNVIGLKNINTRARFKVLRDITFRDDTSSPAFSRQMFLKSPNSHRGKNGQILKHHVVYNGNNSYGRGCMYLMWFSTLATSAPTVEITWETKYFDN